MSIAYKGKKLYIKNFEAMLSSLFCLKVLLKSKTKNNYNDALIFLTKILSHGAPESCLHFYKRGGGLFIKDLIEILIIAIRNINN